MKYEALQTLREEKRREEKRREEKTEFNCAFFSSKTEYICDE